MLKNEFIEVSISYRNKGHYEKLGYSPILNQNLKIKVEDLSSGSHVKVVAVCEICADEKKLMYCKYIDNKKRHGFYSCRKCSRQKAAMTSLERYGVENYAMTDEHRDRVEKTNLEKYGYKTNLQSPEYKKMIKKKLIEKYGEEDWFRIRNGKGSRKKSFELNDHVKSLKKNEIELSEERYSETPFYDDYLEYRKVCRRLTRQKSKKLFERWDGYDYYDGQYIRKYMNLPHNDVNYPTIDHKISVYHGYVNSVSPELICSDENLCITKRKINSLKCAETEESFIQTFSDNTQ